MALQPGHRYRTWHELAPSTPLSVMVTTFAKARSRIVVYKNINLDNDGRSRWLSVQYILCPPMIACERCPQTNNRMGLSGTLLFKKITLLRDLIGSLKNSLDQVPSSPSQKSTARCWCRTNAPPRSLSSNENRYAQRGLLLRKRSPARGTLLTGSKKLLTELLQSITLAFLMIDVKRRRTLLNKKFS